MADPDKCDQEVFDRGHSICILDGCRDRIEEWVQAVARESGQRVDWHYSGGIADVLYLGDYEKVREAVERLSPLLNEAPAKDLDTRCRCTSPNHNPCHLLRLYPPEAHGPYRCGDPLPGGVIAVETH